MGCDGSADDALLKLSGADCDLVTLARIEASMLSSQTLCLIVVGGGRRVKREHCLEAQT